MWYLLCGTGFHKVLPNQTTTWNKIPISYHSCNLCGCDKCAQKKTCIFNQNSIFLPVTIKAVEESVEWKRRLVCTGTTVTSNQWLRNCVKIRILCAK